MNRQNGLKPVARLIAKLIANSTTKVVQTNAADSGSIPFQPMNRKNLTNRLYIIATSFHFWSVSIMDYTISFCICQAIFSDLTRKFLYQTLHFVFVIIILIVNVLYLYRNNYHLYFVKNKSRGYFTTTFCI